jgi:acetyl/propionyl-CoA carboxylase alpha subunit
VIQRILVASRAEVAVRIARTCKRLGLTTVALYLESERDGVHVQACDEAVPLEGEPPERAYQSVRAVVAAAVRAKCDSLIAGSGALGRSAALALATRDAGLRFVGPSPEHLTLAADRALVRKLARQTGVRVIEGSDEPICTLRAAYAEAEALGYPIAIKPAALVPGVVHFADDDDELEVGFDAARAAGRALGDERVLIERRIDRPRVVEVEVVTDARDGFAALGEREVSAQRKLRRLLAESPAPALLALPNTDYVREALVEAAYRLVRAAGVVGSATVAFLLDDRGRHHFLGLDVGLSPEHALHEMCTGQDVVETQIALAMGEGLPESVLNASPTGHAAEANLLFEGPPPDGVVTELRFPNVGAGKGRIDSGLAARSRALPGLDTMVARITTFGPTRHQALHTLDRILAETYVAPFHSNQPTLRRLLAHESFRAGQYDATFVERMIQQRI